MAFFFRLISRGEQKIKLFVSAVIRALPDDGCSILSGLSEANAFTNKANVWAIMYITDSYLNHISFATDWNLSRYFVLAAALGVSFLAVTSLCCLAFLTGAAVCFTECTFTALLSDLLASVAYAPTANKPINIANIILFMISFLYKIKKHH